MEINRYNLIASDVRKIKALTADQLSAVRRNINSPGYTEDETREAVAQYCADGGEVEDLLDF